MKNINIFTTVLSLALLSGVFSNAIAQRETYRDEVLAVTDVTGDGIPDQIIKREYDIKLAMARAAIVLDGKTGKNLMPPNKNGVCYNHIQETYRDRNGTFTATAPGTPNDCGEVVFMSDHTIVIVTREDMDTGDEMQVYALEFYRYNQKKKGYILYRKDYTNQRYPAGAGQQAFQEFPLDRPSNYQIACKNMEAARRLARSGNLEGVKRYIETIEIKTNRKIISALNLCAKPLDSYYNAYSGEFHFNEYIAGRQVNVELMSSQTTGLITSCLAP